MLSPAEPFHTDSELIHHHNSIKGEGDVIQSDTFTPSPLIGVTHASEAHSYLNLTLKSNTVESPGLARVPSLFFFFFQEK